jgi:hypothetical protein
VAGAGSGDGIGVGVGVGMGPGVGCGSTSPSGSSQADRPVSAAASNSHPRAFAREAIAWFEAAWGRNRHSGFGTGDALCADGVPEPGLS